MTAMTVSHLSTMLDLFGSETSITRCSLQLQGMTDIVDHVAMNNDSAL